MKAFIKTYGCQMNERDSDALAAHMQQPHMETIKDLKSRFALDAVIERYE